MSIVYNQTATAATSASGATSLTATFSSAIGQHSIVFMHLVATGTNPSVSAVSPSTLILLTTYSSASFLYNTYMLLNNTQAGLTTFSVTLGGTIQGAALEAIEFVDTEQSVASIYRNVIKNINLLQTTTQTASLSGTYGMARYTNILSIYSYGMILPNTLNTSVSVVRFSAAASVASSGGSPNCQLQAYLSLPTQGLIKPQIQVGIQSAGTIVWAYHEVITQDSQQIMNGAYGMVVGSRYA